MKSISLLKTEILYINASEGFIYRERDLAKIPGASTSVVIGLRASHLGIYIAASSVTCTNYITYLI